MSLPLKRCLTGNKFLKYTSFQVPGICNQFHRIPAELFKIWANCDYIGTEKSKSEKIKFTKSWHYQNEYWYWRCIQRVTDRYTQKMEMKKNPTLYSQSYIYSS